MSPLAFYRQLIAAGVDDDTAFAMAEKFEAEREAEVRATYEGLMEKLARPADPVAEKRRAYDRERKARPRSTGIPPETAEFHDAPIPETKVSPTPLSKTQTLTPSQNPPKGGQKGSRLPENWRPDEGARAYAIEVLGPNVDPERELDRFRDYWRAVPGAKGLKLDWPATWRNWCRSAADRLPSQRKAHERSHPDAKFDARQANLARHDAGADLAARLHGQS